MSTKTEHIVDDEKLPGPRSLFRHKVRAPISMLLTAAGHELDAQIRQRTGLSRGDLYELLLIKFGDKIKDQAA